MRKRTYDAWTARWRRERDERAVTFWGYSSSDALPFQRFPCWALACGYVDRGVYAGG